MSNNNNNKESWALRQQKYTNAIIRGRRHVPTPEPIPPSTLLDAPKLPDVPLPSPPRERVRNNRPPNLVTNLKKSHPAPQGGYTSANRYTKTPTHPDENADAVGRYIDRMEDIKCMQDNMGKKKYPHNSQRSHTPAPVLMEDQWTGAPLGDKEGMTAGEQYGQKKVAKSQRRKAVRRIVEDEEMLSLGVNETIPAPKQHKKRTHRKHKQKCTGEDNPAEDFQPMMMEEYFLVTAAMDQMKDNAAMEELERNNVVDIKPKRKTRRPAESPSHLAKENTTLLTSPEASDFVVQEDHMYRVQDRSPQSAAMYISVQDRSPVQEKTHRRKNSQKARKQERTILPSLTSDLGLTLQGTKLATPGVSLPSIGDGRGLVTKPAQLPDIQDEDLEECEQLPLLEFGTKAVGKTVSATVTYEPSKDHTKARSTKRRKTSKRSALKDKKARRHRHESPNLADDEL